MEQEEKDDNNNNNKDDKVDNDDEDHKEEEEDIDKKEEQDEELFFAEILKMTKYTSLSNLVRLAQWEQVSEYIHTTLRWSEKWKCSKKSLAHWFSCSFTKLRCTVKKFFL